MLLLSETHDAPTPFEGALEVRARFPRSVLIEGAGGTSHSAALTGGSACTNNAVADYLAKGTTPTRLAGRKADRRCAPTPQPGPTDD